MNEILHDNTSLTERLLEFSKKTGYEVVQENGQRRITCPDLLNGNITRAKGAEVFVGRLPRNCYEDELWPMLATVGRVLELRMMLDFSGSNRGYGFALYVDAKTARKACELLDRKEIRKGHEIGIVKSVDNCRLFFGGVPKEMTKEEFFRDLSQKLEGIVDVYAYPSAQNRNLNRGFIFVEFKDHRSAAMARRQLIPGKVILWEHEIAVDWADPEPGDPVDTDLMETVTALFVRNLPLELTPQQMKDIITKAAKVPILKLKKINHFAFVHFETRQLAERVLTIMNKPGGVAEINQWEVRWAKPISNIKTLERQKHIEEATKTQPIEKQSKKKMKNKKNSKSLVPTLAPIPEHCMSFVLEDFVFKSYQAFCKIELCRFMINLEMRYKCRIQVLKANFVVFEYFPEEFQNTEQEAIHRASYDAYLMLGGLIDNNQAVCPKSPTDIHFPEAPIDVGFFNSALTLNEFQHAS